MGEEHVDLEVNNLNFLVASKQKGRMLEEPPTKRVMLNNSFNDTQDEGCKPKKLKEVFEQHIFGMI
jgi:hypothetical protein